jgi:hypothetical protein
MIVEWVRGQMPEGSEAWELVARLIADSASAWQVPSLGPYADAAAMGPGL